MQCTKCGHEKLSVIKVERNRIRRNGIWIVANDKDTRIVVCDNCGKRYLTETTLMSEVVFNTTTLKRYEKSVASGQTFLFEPEYIQ